MKTNTDFNEYEGLKNLLLFLHKSLRNVEAHKLRVEKEIELDRALDIFVCISLVYKYLDKASVTFYVQQP